LAVVILGAGHAGVQLADSLRREHYAGPITLIGEEQEDPYQRPPLTKDYLRDDGATEHLLLRAPSFYTSRDVDLRLGCRAVRIDRERRRVLLDDESVVHYDQLVLATGSSSRRYAGVEPDDPVIYMVHRARDAERFGGALSSAASLAIVGAGFIGLEVAAAARARNVEVTILTLTPPASRVATPELSRFLQEAHSARGSRFIVDEVTEIGHTPADTGTDPAGGVVSTASHGHITAQLVLVATGVVPNVELATAAGLTVSDGVEVDAFSRTSDECIWAIGDIAARPGPRGDRVRYESVHAASHQAQCLALTLTGRPTAPWEVPWFWSNQGDIRLQIAGTPCPEAETVVRGRPEGGRFSVFCFDGGRLVAVESVNAPGDHLAARRILTDGSRLDPAQLADPTFDLKEFSRGVARTPA
jgi:3-phenylpropionate/trans-cinnamate dioxygenase ferredoxin reductase component